MNATNATTTKRERAERKEIVPGDDVLLRLADLGGTWRIAEVTETGWDLIRDEPYLILADAPGRIFAGDVVYISRLG